MKTPKIIQINTTAYNNKEGYLLLGLDDQGKVWYFNHDLDKWIQEARSLEIQGDE